MSRAQRGFSLIEAMIALLVLSVGLLGLAQLQARLSMAALRLAASAQAHLLGAAEIEHSLATLHAEREDATDTRKVISTPATRFELKETQVPMDGLMRLEVDIRWHHSAGRQELRLATLANPAPKPFDYRLLLPASQ